MSVPVAGLPFAGHVPVIETERLRLRAHRAEDYATSLAIWSDPEVVRYIGGRPSSPEDVWKRLLQNLGLWSLLGYGYWAVEEKASGGYVGDIGFADFRRAITPPLQDMLEFGWVLAPAAHGKGYASEVVAAIMSWAQTHFADRRMVCMISPDNHASIRVAEKAGFRPWQHTTYHDSPTIVFTR